MSPRTALPAPGVDYGVRYRYSDGGEPFVSGGWTLAGARAMVAACGKGFDPEPVQVMVRDVPEWRAYDETPTS